MGLDFIDLLFYLLGRFAWKLLDVCGIKISRPSDGGFEALGLVVFLLMMALAFLLFSLI